MNRYTRIFRKTKPTAVKPPWVLWLPPGVRERPSWVFIGTLVALTGLTYVFGLTTSSIALVIGAVGLKIWGGILSASGFGVIVATVRNNPAFEKLALRFMSLSIFAYVAWIITAVGIGRAAMTLVFGAFLITSCEIRSAFIRLMLNNPNLFGANIAGRWDNHNGT